MSRIRSRRAFAFASSLALLGASCSDGGSLSADAGSDFSVAVGESPEFNACDSTGEIANYAWTIAAAPDGAGDQEGKAIRDTSADCSFVLEAAMVPEEVGSWTIELTVSDDEGSSSTDSVVIEVTE